MVISALSAILILIVTISPTNIVEVKTKRQIIFRFQKLPLKTTEISHFFEGKIEKVGV